MIYIVIFWLFLSLAVSSWTCFLKLHKSMQTCSTINLRRNSFLHFTTLMNSRLTRSWACWNLTRLCVKCLKAIWQNKERFSWKQHQYQCWSHPVHGALPRMVPTLSCQVRNLLVTCSKRLHYILTNFTLLFCRVRQTHEIILRVCRTCSTHFGIFLWKTRQKNQPANLRTWR